MTARGRKRAAPVVEAVTTAPLTVTGPGWELRRGSCLDPVTGLASLADRSVAHAFQDPPYDEHTHSATRRGHTGYAESESSARATFSRSTSLGFDAITAKDMAETGRQIARVVRGWAGTFCSVEMVSDWRRHFEAGGMDYVRTAAWRKIGSTPQFSGDRPATAFEAIVLTHQPGRKRWNGGGSHGWYDVAASDDAVYECPIVLNRGDGTVRLHTTQKPLVLIERLIADFTQPGDLVLDGYSGSGTTALACLRLGRRFIGWELDPTYFDIACRRVRGDEARPRPEQPSLFASLETP